MGQREFKKLQKKYPFITFMETWPRGLGRWMKRRLSKARRKYAKERLNGRKGKEPSGIESEVNWKGW